MTERDPRLDELVSAHLDGESSAEEAARVTEDPELRDRLERFAAVRDAVRDVPAPVDAARDATVGRVLAALDAPERVATISPVRPRRIAASRLLAVAAAFLAVAFLGAAVGMLSRGGGGDDDGSSVARTMAEDSGSDAAGGSAGGSATADEPKAPQEGMSAYLADPAELGSFPDLEALRRRADELATPSANDSGPAPPTPTTAASAESAEAPRTAAGCALPAGPRWVADLDGRLVVVVVDAATITVVDAADCTTVATFAR
jgi:hypothetical protein